LAELPVDLDVLRRWLDARAIGSGDLEEPELLAGGTQNILLRFSRAGETYVLRRPPLHLRAKSNETMLREARVLRALARTDVPHPSLVALCEDEGVLGAVFYLMRHVEGFNATRGLPPLHASSAELRRRMGLALVTGIANLARHDYRSLGLEGFGRPEGYLERQVARTKAQLAGYAEIAGWDGAGDLRNMPRISSWLEANIPRAYKPALIHGDYHIANVMFRHESAELAAIVDWELSTVGDSLLDLGWLIATWPEEVGGEDNPFDIHPWRGFPSAAELTQHYAQITNQSLTSLPWYVVLACFKLGIILEGTYARACAGHAPREVGLRLHTRTVALLERAIRQIDGEIKGQ
jgi:aminoglycoside phosphotransferase (APT) family kinase protein